MTAVTEQVAASAPGRVNLMGDHTDHSGGLVLPVAIDLGTTVEGARDDRVVLTSDHEHERAEVPLDVVDPAAMQPAWARYVGGVVAEVRPSAGLRGQVTSTLPVGAGLSSSAALEVALALALGAPPGSVETARRCQRAEQRATGVPCGIMDQLTSVLGRGGHALRIDCSTLAVDPVPLPDGIEIVVVDSGERRELAASGYAARVADCRRAESTIGPLRGATLPQVASLADPVLRRRARHVVSENERVDALAAALRADDRSAMAEGLAASHASLRDDFDVSTPALDALVAELVATPGVIGARLTGAGFGGCAVALVESGTELDGRRRWWRVRASDGAHLR